MPSNIIQLADQQPAKTVTTQLFEDWFDPIETAVRDRVHGFMRSSSATFASRLAFMSLSRQYRECFDW